MDSERVRILGKGGRWTRDILTIPIYELRDCAKDPISIECNKL